MTIKKVCIENFTVFENVEIDFSSGVNIIIGTNGTGKTHLLKSLYALCESVNNKGEDIFDISQPFFKVNPMNLVRDQRDRNKKTHVTAYFSKNSYVSHVIIKHEGMKLAGDGASYSDIDFKVKNVFIPAKEMLSHAQGFLAMYNKYSLPFDKTYADIITNAELPETRAITPINEMTLQKISEVIDGHVIHEKSSFYVVKSNGKKIEFQIEAEGLRKFGLLWKLIRNGLIEEGTILFWDEPEANINPELIPVLVDILLELQRSGVQVFIATHNYNLAKYFEIKRKKDHKVKFHHLYKTNDGVQADSSDYFGELPNNPIIEADTELLDQVIESNFEV
ncbi:AAA family ATPase [Alkalihalobacterium bogoriense]|uniref:AAA family ATPase n=1 Tax=Alkalihalobacterium bogoriense TaxID=246272 RepID=UPI0004797EA3|nr:AAA family ATPase [Alkalihalobacterium bogoriense]